MAASNDSFYVRYYSGHSGRFGHEFLEFDFRTLGDGRSASARYANNSNYRNDSLIRKEMCVSSLLIAEIKRIIKESEIMKEDDSKWPEKNKDGRQELEIRLGNEHISFETAKIGSLVDVTESADPEGLRVFYYLVQDLKALVFSLISLHFKMPTPSDSVIHAPFQPGHSLHITCPPDAMGRSEYNHFAGPSPRHAGPGSESRRMGLPQHSDQESSIPPNSINNLLAPPKMPGALPDDSEDYLSSSSGEIFEASSSDSVDTARPQTAEPSQSLMSVQQESAGLPAASDIHGLPRMIPTLTSSFLRPFSRFRGQQQSDKQVYQVEVELKYVDMAESTLCGFLKIEGKPLTLTAAQLQLLTPLNSGLTDNHPTLTTFFEGEIIGPKYTFQTRHPSWGATDKTDMQHWARFPAWRPLAKQAKKPDFHYKNYAQRENIFMRWKESFLVPDHRVREISGASFEGFYYICFNQVSGDINGIYFHAKSEKYQQLELKHVPDHGCFPAMEFR
ncbi:MAG: hypothetical protein LQ343_004974 [Gyalolechia ehrenbergii]|nr:MAG: hypothetical protein LQ343_004974 [Gyalolechia ehrenbergii]